MIWAYTFMYTCPRWFPLPREKLVGRILNKISSAGRGNITQGAVEWMKAEMGVDGEEVMFGMVKDFVKTNYWWMWEFSINRLI